MFVGSDQVQVFNNVLYVGADYTEDSLSKDRAYSVDLHAAGSTTQPTFTELTYTLGSSINKPSRFAINPVTTDLVYYNQLTPSGAWSLFSYQLFPQLKIVAGETTGTITFTATDDTTDEANETIIVTAGTAVNATNSEAAVTVTINDNDAPEAVTFELSTATIVEGSSTTANLTATVAEVSEQDITIPFTLTGSASADEYTVSAVSSIVPLQLGSINRFRYNYCGSR